MLGKKNGSPKKICVACGHTFHKLSNGLCDGCKDQAEMSAFLAGEKERSAPDGFWSKLFWFLTLFGRFGDHDDNDGGDR